MVNGRISPRVKYEEFKSSLVLVCCHNNRDTRCGFQVWFCHGHSLLPVSQNNGRGA